MTRFKAACIVLIAQQLQAGTTSAVDAESRRRIQSTYQGSCTSSTLSPGELKSTGSFLCYPMPSSGKEPLYKFGIGSDNNLAYYAYDKLIWKAVPPSMEESKDCIVFGNCDPPPMAFFRLQNKGSLVGFDVNRNKIWDSHENIENNGKYSLGVFLGDGSTDAVGDPISGSTLGMSDEGIFIQSSGEEVTWMVLAPEVEAPSSSQISETQVGPSPPTPSVEEVDFILSGGDAMEMEKGPTESSSSAQSTPSQVTSAPPPSIGELDFPSPVANPLTNYSTSIAGDPAATTPTSSSTSSGTNKINGDTEIVIHVTVSDILILSSAALSILKSLLAFEAYSPFHVLLALIELACTALAFSIFILDEFLDEDGIAPTFGSDDIYIFLLAYASSCIVEVIDVFFTYNTVRAYRSVYKENDDALVRRGRKMAKCFYTCGLLIATISAGITPMISFGKSGWNMAYFSPSPFSPQNSKFLLIYLIMMLSGQIIQSVAVVAHGIEMGGEYTRMNFWVEAKEKSLSEMLGDDNDTVTEGGNGDDFDEPEGEDDDDKDGQPDLEAGDNSNYGSAETNDDMSFSDE
eukprot:scaffold20357_cov39-Cyclotella_meneghiniana.AAC.3